MKCKQIIWTYNGIILHCQYINRGANGTVLQCPRDGIQLISLTSWESGISSRPDVQDVSKVCAQR